MSKETLPLSTILTAVFVTVMTVSVVTAFVMASDIFLILFLAILFGVFLYHSSHSLEAKVGLSYSQSVGLITTTLVTTTLVGFGTFGFQVDRQLDDSGKHLDQAVHQLENFCQKYPTLGSLVSSTPILKEMVDVNGDIKQSSAGRPFQSGKESKSDAQSSKVEQAAIRNAARQVATALANLFQTTFGLLVNSLLIFFVGLFIAINPQTYRDGVVILFPQPRHERVREIMNEMGETLWSWLLGRFGSMLITGLGAGLLLFFLGVPMAATLGIITALLTFIPNIGGLVSLLLAMLFAMPQGRVIVGCVLGGYILLQLIESYVVTPLIQKKQVSIPPALLIAFQAVMGILFGLLGAAVASPLLAASKVCVEKAYIKDVLSRDPSKELNESAS